MELESPGVFVRSTSLRAPQIAGADTTVTAFVGGFASGPVGTPITCSSRVEFDEMFDDAVRPTASTIAVRDYFANGGEQAIVVRAAGAGTGPRAAATPSVDALIDGLDSLLPPDRSTSLAAFQVAVPDMARRADHLGAADYRHLVERATQFCHDHRSFLIVDPNPAEDTLEAMLGWLHDHADWGSADAAAYWPRLVTPAATEAGIDAAPASGAVAGIMARTDRRRGVWKAPAGVEATVDATVATAITDEEQSPLNRQGINVIRDLPMRGTVVWGSRTGAGTVGHDWRYVPVRRLALFLERSLHDGLDWVREQRSEPQAWREIRLSVENFLRTLWHDGAFAGSTPDQAFFVRCDRTTMTRSDVRRGRTIVQIGFAPLRPAEFVILDVTLQKRR